MRHRSLSCLAAFTTVLASIVVACSGSSSSPSNAPPVVQPEEDSSTEVDAEVPVDAAPDSPKPTGKCADTFGSALTEGFGRADGLVWAVQKPSDTGCVFPNSDHVIVQVLINSAVYRMVVNVQSDRAGVDPKIRVGTMSHALPPPAFSEGWHLAAPLDYVTTLGAHSTDPSFSALTLADAVTKIAAEVKVGDLISVYAESGAGRPESTHLVHRNKTDQDGALVVSPTTSPKFLLFHFENQTF